MREAEIHTMKSGITLVPAASEKQGCVCPYNEACLAPCTGVYRCCDYAHMSWAVLVAGAPSVRCSPGKGHVWDFTRVKTQGDVSLTTRLETGERR